MTVTGTVNKVILVGEITHTPRWHKHESGNNMLCFTLTTREQSQQNGRQTEHTEEHSIKLPANKLEYELKLGQWVHIEGKIKTSSFIDDKTVTRYKSDVIATRVHPLANGQLI